MVEKRDDLSRAEFGGSVLKRIRILKAVGSIE